jgi:hypothetical protein
MKRIYTHSELATYQQCPQCWHFKFRELLTPIITSGKLQFGRIIHEALRIYYSAGKAETKVVEYISQTFEDLILKASGAESDVAALIESKILAINIMMNYFRFAMENDDFEIVEIETPRKVVIDTPNGNKSNKFEYAFIPDQILRRNGKIWIHEFKTAESIDSGYLTNLILDEQMSRYSFAYEKYCGESVQGVLYTILRKAVPRLPDLLKNGTLTRDKRIDTTYNVYLQAIRDNNQNESNYIEILDILKNKGNTFIKREIVLRNEKEKRECEGRLYILAKTLSVEPPIYKCPSRDCLWKCDFRGLCIEDTPELRVAGFKIRETYHPEMNEIPNETGETKNENSK